MTIGYTRPTKAIINREAIYHNIKKHQKLVGDDVDVFAVVKANGYGHGAVQTAQIAVQAGVNGFCVSLLDEALELREAGITLPILILGVIPPYYGAAAAEDGISVTVPSYEWLEHATRQLIEDKPSQLPLRLHLGIDTGMGRIGFREVEELKQAIDFIQAHPTLLELEGVFTHFSKADSKDESYFALQQARFAEAMKIVPNGVRYRHTANSATTLWHDHWQSNMVRIGASMYGINPSGDELEPPFELEPAMSLETMIVHVKQVAPGEKIGYGATYETTENEWIATIPIGYADGFVRRFQGFSVLVDGEYCEIVGRVCMDQSMIRLPRKFEEGTKVTIFGENNGQFISLQAGADHIGSINYEIPCVLSERVPLVYTH